MAQMYRLPKLNEKIIKARYPLPIIEDQIDRLQKAKVFSTIDLKNGFFHVLVAKDSRKYTSFVVPNGQYEFLCMPFVLCVASAYFQRYINAVFADLMAEGVVMVYMDDLIILSIDSEEGIHKLARTLQVANTDLTLIRKNAKY